MQQDRVGLDQVKAWLLERLETDPNMIFETTTTLSAAEIFARAKRFFAERVPQSAAFPEREGPAYLVLRGQGGEEIALAVFSQGRRHARARLDAALRSGASIASSRRCRPRRGSGQ